jgi:hypothetical protein
VQIVLLQPSRALGDYVVSLWDIRVMTARRRAGKGQCHLSAGYIFALRVVEDLPHNRALLPLATLLID